MKSSVDPKIKSCAASGRWLILGTLVALGACSGQIGDIGGQGGPNHSNGSGPDQTDDGSGLGGVVNGKWLPPACNKNEPAFAPARIWQITDQEYVNIVRDVLGITLTGADAEIYFGGQQHRAFTNLSEGGGLFNDMLAQNYQNAAQKVASQAYVEDSRASSGPRLPPPRKYKPSLRARWLACGVGCPRAAR